MKKNPVYLDCNLLGVLVMLALACSLPGIGIRPQMNRLNRPLQRPLTRRLLPTANGSNQPATPQFPFKTRRFTRLHLPVIPACRCACLPSTAAATACRWT